MPVARLCALPIALCAVMVLATLYGTVSLALRVRRGDGATDPDAKGAPVSGVPILGADFPSLSVSETALGAYTFGVTVTCTPPPTGLNCQNTSPPFQLTYESGGMVPANRDNMVAKAAGVAADVITLDLEDSVPDAEKEATRGKLEAAMKRRTDLTDSDFRSI